MNVRQLIIVGVLLVVVGSSGAKTACERSGDCLFCPASRIYSFFSCRRQGDCQSGEKCQSHINGKDAYCCAKAVIQYSPTTNTGGGGSQYGNRFCYDGSVGSGYCTNNAQCGNGAYCSFTANVCCRNRQPIRRRSCADTVCPTGRVCQWANNSAICVRPNAVISPQLDSYDAACRRYPRAPTGCRVKNVRKETGSGCYSYYVDCSGTASSSSAYRYQ